MYVVLIEYLACLLMDSAGLNTTHVSIKMTVYSSMEKANVPSSFVATLCDLRLHIVYVLSANISQICCPFCLMVEF